jgi:hypothetical protein
VQQPEPKAQEVRLTAREPGEVVVECPDHKPCNFVKGKPRSIISLLISKMQLKYYVIYIVALSWVLDENTCCIDIQSLSS